MSASIPRAHSRSPSAGQPSLLPSALPREASPRPDTGTSQPPSIPTLSHEASQESEGQPPLPPIDPFFVHVDDAHTSATHHPAVHYIFSDDDGGLLTDTLSRLDSAPAQAARAATSRAQGSSRRSSAAHARPPSERVVVVSLGADGRSVEAAHSMSPDWQVLGVDVLSAPTLEGGGEHGGLMLRIRGTGGVDEVPREPARDDAASEQSLEAVVANYRERMEELKTVLEAGNS